MRAGEDDRTRVGFDEQRSYTLPFRATGFTFGKSQNHPQLQACDLLAGASAALGRYVVDRSRQPEYANALMDAGIESMSIGMLWPNPDDVARRRRLPGAALADPLSALGRLIRAAEQRRDT